MFRLLEVYLLMRKGEKEFMCTCRVDTPTEVLFVSAGGILPFVLDVLARES